jgi:hypothetical protein
LAQGVGLMESQDPDWRMVRRQALGLQQVRWNSFAGSGLVREESAGIIAAINVFGHLNVEIAPFFGARKTAHDCLHAGEEIGAHGTGGLGLGEKKKGDRGKKKEVHGE